MMSWWRKALVSRIEAAAADSVAQGQDPARAHLVVRRVRRRHYAQHDAQHYAQHLHHILVST